MMLFLSCRDVSLSWGLLVIIRPNANSSLLCLLCVIRISFRFVNALLCSFWFISTLLLKFISHCVLIQIRLLHDICILVSEIL